MIAIDTNVFVRLIVDDDPTQTVWARTLVSAGPIWVSLTVWLETRWALASNFGLTDSQIHMALVNILALENVHSENEAALETALSLMGQGVDFADALHLTSTPPDIPFVTFDRAFIRRAKRAGVTGISEPSSHLSR